MKITISGLRGEGKTTLAAKLAGYLSSLGHHVCVEPETVRALDSVYGALSWPKRIEIVTDNSNQEDWDGLVEAKGLGNIDVLR